MESRASHPSLAQILPRRYTGGAPCPPNGSVATEPALELWSRMAHLLSHEGRYPDCLHGKPVAGHDQHIRTRSPLLGQVLPDPGQALGQQAGYVHLADAHPGGNLRLGQSFDEPKPDHLLLPFG